MPAAAFKRAMPWLPSDTRHARAHRSGAAFPSQQLFILALCRICEPIAFMSVFPYVYYMVLSFDLTSDTQRIALYVGLVTSAFAFAEFSSGVIWGRISDRVGRKPVLLAGLLGTAISMMVFGFATNLPVALLARALGGLLNGNMGVLQTTVAEIVTVKEHQPRAFSIMPFVWCLGSVLGPAMGGALAQPSKSFPTLFPRGTLFDRYPFLLPNVVCTVVLICGVTIGVLFLEETHEMRKHQPDVGLQAGKWILRRLKLTTEAAPTLSQPSDKAFQSSATGHAHLTEDEELPEYAPADGADLPGYRTRDGTPRQSSSRTHSPCPPPLGKLHGRQECTFNKRVILIIVGFGILAYHSISFDQLMPIFLSEPVSQKSPSLPFSFSGGFGYSTKRIGFMLAVQGVYSMVAQLFIFPWAAHRLGSLNTFRLAISIWPLLYLLVPYLVLLPAALQPAAVYAALLLKITFHVLAFPATAILVANAAPSKSVLGLVNGAAASTASLARAFGPTFTGALHAWGLKVDCAGLAWWVSGIICLVGAIESFWIEESSSDADSGDVATRDDGSSEHLLDPAAIEAAISTIEEGAGDDKVHQRGGPDAKTHLHTHTGTG